MNTRLRSLASKLTDTEKPKAIDWILTIALIIFCYFSFNHGDIFITSTHGKDLVECFLQGKFFEFYDYTESTAVYSITVYIVFAIWSLPVMLGYKVLGIPLWGTLDYFAIPYPVLMWYKLLPTLCYLAIAYLLYKIVLEIKMDRNTAKWVSFLFISSPIAMFSQFIFGQYDSLGLLFTVWALYMFIKKKYYAFSILCSVAVTFKMFALFFFIPLLLLVEKRPLHIIKHLIIAMSGYVLTSCLFANSQGYGDAMDFSGNIVSRLFFSGIQTQMGTISLFTVAMILVCILAYNKNISDIHEYYAYSIYIPFFVYAAMFAFILWHPQWVIFLMPFMALAVVLNSKTNASLLLHSIMAVGYVGATVMFFVNNVDACLLNYGVFAEVFGRKDVGCLSELFGFGGALGSNFYFSLFAGSLFVLMLTCYPTSANIQHLGKSIQKKKFVIGDRLFILLRPLILLLFILPALYLFFS